MLGGALLGASGCASEQCDLSLTLGGAIEWAWVWQEPGTTCEINTEALLLTSSSSGAAVRFTHGDTEFFEFALPMPLGDGTFLLDAVTYSQGGQFWTSEDLTGLGGSAICSVSIQGHEVVDWVQHDHHRFTGTLVCDGPLDEIGGDGELFVSAVTFAVYAPEGYF